ncbi:arylsulfatase [Compostibacter hankyongensis]|uniref:Arylsulfatase n=1 Tax=Compostibacter hankyongensis TaxID=1007089 RepID=A0ABP8FJU5_9BACT
MFKHIILSGCLQSLFCLQLFAQQPAETPPNIILILADDMGYGQLGCYGQQIVRTPNIDTLAARGIRFTGYYAGCSVCAPSREALMTGMHTGHTAIRGNFRLAVDDGNLPMAANHPTLAEYLKSQGYRTALFGKWGVGDSLTGPGSRGFDESLCYMDQMKAHNYYPPYLWKDDKRLPLEANEGGRHGVYSHSLFVEKTLEFIRKSRPGQPFFLYLPYTIPHGDYMLPPDTPYIKQPWPEALKTYATMVSLLDRDVGRILSLLKEKGLAENTLILFTSDNGANAGPAKLFRANGPFRGAKLSLYEGGIREPFIACWPARIKAGRVTRHVTAAWDLLPTLCQIAGVRPSVPVDGISFLPALLGKGQQPQHPFLYWELYDYNYNWQKPGNRLPRNWLQSRAVRMGKWKGIQNNVYKDKQAAIALYDLEKDPGEQHDAAAEHPDIISRIKTIFARSSTPDPPYFPYRAVHN